jgi:two-component system sensor kinase FixL
MKFAPKLTALFIIIGAIIAAVMFTIVYFQVEKILESEIRARMENRVFFTMDALERFLYERLSDIKMIAKDSVISSEDATAEQITEKLIFFRNAYKCYASFSFFNLERIRIADTAGLDIGEQNRMTPYWEEVLSGKVSAASDVHIAKDLQVPVVYFASAVDNKEGRAIGVVVARIPINRLFEMVKGSAKIQEEEEEEIDIMNKDGLLIYSNHNREGILKENLPEWESVKIAQREKIFGRAKHRNPGEKETALYAFCREQGHLDFKGNGWTIFFHIPTRVIFSPVNKLLKMLIITFLAMLPVLVLVIYLFSKTVSLPLARLTFAVAEVGKGKLDTLIEVKSKDEFGSLANIFNQMAADLKKTTISIDDLNKEITERRRAQVKLQRHIKQLNCLYDLSKLAVRPQILLDQIFQETAKLVRGVYRYPDITCVRITFNGIQYKTDNFKKTEISQHADIRIRGERVGSIEVYCLEDRRENGEGPLLKEEAALLNVVAEQLGRTAELKQTTDKLQLFRNLIEQSNDCIFVLEPRWGRFLDANETACRTLGYTREELLNMSIKDVEQSTENGTSQQEETKELKLKTDIIKQGKYRRRDGTTFWAETSLKPVSRDGKEYVIAVARDITERKQAEETLRKSEAKYKALVENIPQKVFMKDRNSVYISCNESYARDLKIKPDEIVGKTDYDFFPNELAEKYRMDDKKIMESGNVSDIEEAYIQDGKRLYVRTVKVPVSRGASGEVRDILGIFWDITERKQAEEALQASEARYKVLFFNAAEGIVAADLQTKRFSYANPAICRMFGYTEEELTRIGVADIHPKESLDHVLAEFEAQVRGEKTLANSLPCLRKDGTLFYADVSATSAVLGDRKCLVGFFTDITERKQAEEKQARLVEEIEDANQELKDFAHIVSHDLKAPLCGIRTVAEWISADYADKLDEKGREQLGMLMERVERMYKLIDGVLAYSRVGRLKEKRIQVNLNELIRSIIDSLAVRENISIVVENELPVLECEETRITQVFQNLMSNAVKYMDKPEGQIRISCIEENGRWKFGVADNGPGIEEKDFERIFKIFQTASQHKTAESTGIGLSIVKKIVELYGGKIWVESKVGEGSTFFFTLPKREVEVKNANCETCINC